MSLTEDQIIEIVQALANHQKKCDDLYFEMRDDLARIYKVSEDDIEDIWEERG